MSSDPLAWHLVELTIDDDYPLSGVDIRVALIDTGVDATHPALAGRVVAAFECSGAGLVPIDHTVNHDFHGHGTRMAGLICADRIHGGVAPGARIVSLVYQQNTYGYAGLYSALLGLVAAVTNQRLAVDVVNLSAGMQLPPLRRRLIHALIVRLLKEGILVVSAVGNQPPLAGLAADCPAAFPEVLGVGASDPQHRVCDSSRNNPDVVAPGEQILTCERGGTYSTSCQGTSPATAIATGVAALYLEQARRSPDQLRQQIAANCVRLVGYSSHRQGHGPIQQPT